MGSRKSKLAAARHVKCNASRPEGLCVGTAAVRRRSRSASARRLLEPGGKIVGHVVDVVPVGGILRPFAFGLDEHGCHAELGRRNEVARQVFDERGTARVDVVGMDQAS